MLGLPTLHDIQRQLPRMRTRRDPETDVDLLHLGDSGPDSPLATYAAWLYHLCPTTAPIPVQGTLDLDEVFRHHCMGDHDQSMHTIRSASSSVHWKPGGAREEGFLLDQIQEALQKQTPVIVYLDWLGYAVEETAGKPNASQAHSTTLLLTQDQRGQWGAFHFNPHGDFTRHDYIYEQYRTRSRVRSVRLPQSLDVWIVEQLISCLNEQVEEHVSYDKTSRHNYFGPNLQEGDTTGTCYVFPFLLHYMMACDGSCKLLRAVSQGRGSAAIAKMACTWLGVRYSSMPTETKAEIKRNASGNSRKLALMLLRSVAGVAQTRSRGLCAAF